MATIAEQLAALPVADSLKHASQPANLTLMPWNVANGTWAEATGWIPPSYLEGIAGLRGGLYVNTGKVSGNYGVGLKKTTGALSSPRQFDIWLFHQGTSKVSGYHLAVVADAANKVHYILRKWTGESEPTVLFESAKELAFNENDSFFLARNGSRLEVYRRSLETTPELIGEAEDTTYTEGYIGFGGNGSNPKLINLQGGSLTPEDYVRTFNGSEWIRMGGGEARNTERDRTLVAIVNYEEDGTVFSTLQAGNQQVGGSPDLEIHFGNIAGWQKYYEGAEPFVKLTKGNWSLIAATKVAGLNKVRLHVYDFVKKTWVHQTTGESALEAAFNSRPNFIIGGLLNAVGPFKGKISAIAIFDNVAMSDAQVESLITAPTIASWASTYPAATTLWILNQKEVSIELKDSSLSGANQIKIEGTSVVKEQVPIAPGTVQMDTVQCHQGIVKKCRRWIMRAAGLVNQ